MTLSKFDTAQGGENALISGIIRLPRSARMLPVGNRPLNRPSVRREPELGQDPLF